MNTSERKRLKQAIKDSLSYDGEPDATCPHCKNVIYKGRVWLYHRRTIAGEICKTMGWGALIQNGIERIFEDATVSGDPITDAKNLAELISEQV